MTTRSGLPYGAPGEEMTLSDVVARIGDLTTLVLETRSGLGAQISDLQGQINTLTTRVDTLGVRTPVADPREDNEVRNETDDMLPSYPAPPQARSRHARFDNEREMRQRAPIRQGDYLRRDDFPDHYERRYYDDDYDIPREYGNRNGRNQDRYDRREDDARRIKVDAPEYDGRFDPEAFSDWMSSMDKFFDWQGLADEQRVRFAKMKLIKQANVYWNSVERDLERTGQPPITHWEEMKVCLSRNYLPLGHKDRLMEQINSLRQGSMSVAEYVSRYRELIQRCDLRESTRMSMIRFKEGLRPELKNEIVIAQFSTLDDVFQFAVEHEYRAK